MNTEQIEVSEETTIPELPELDPIKIAEWEALKYKTLEFQSALALALAQFEQATGRRVDRVYIQRTNSPLEGWMSTANEAEFYAKFPEAKAVLNHRIEYVQVILEALKEEEVS